MNQNHFSVSLCIVGSGSEEERLHQYVLQNKLEARVMFVGFTRDTDYYLRRSLLFVSSSENEGAPLSFLDAMHHELPIICLQFPSVQEIVIQGKTGYVFQNRNMFIQHVLFLLSHPQIRMRMGRQAANWVNSHYSPKNILEYLNC